MSIDMTIVVDSKDLYTTLITQSQSIDRSIHGDIGVVRFEFEVQNVSKIVWIAGKLSLANVGTEFDSHLNDVMAQLLSTGKISCRLDSSEACQSNHSLG